jgi:hypothetical protein
MMANAMLQEYQSDHSGSYVAANKLADKIRRYWAAKGVNVRVMVQRQPTPRGVMPLYDIRSDIVLSGRPA